MVAVAFFLPVRAKDLSAPLVYINDLPLNILDAKLVLFADYINIFIRDKNIDAVQEG